MQWCRKSQVHICLTFLLKSMDSKCSLGLNLACTHHNRDDGFGEIRTSWGGRNDGHFYWYTTNLRHSYFKVQVYNLRCLWSTYAMILKLSTAHKTLQTQWVGLTSSCSMLIPFRARALMKITLHSAHKLCIPLTYTTREPSKNNWHTC